MKKTSLNIGDLVRYPNTYLNSGSIGIIVKIRNYTYCDVLWINNNITDEHVEKSHLKKVN